MRRLERAALHATESVGSLTSILIHTIAFVVIFALHFVGVHIDIILLILTTAVSLEAIYLAIFIQMTVNRNTQSLEEVEEDIDEIQKDIDEVQEDVEGIEKDVDEIQADIDEVQKDVEVISDDDAADAKTKMTLETIEVTVQKLMEEIQALKQQK